MTRPAHRLPDLRHPVRDRPAWRRRVLSSPARAASLVGLAVALTVTMPVTGDDDETSPPAAGAETQPAEMPTRVILRLGRQGQVRGTIAFEDEELIFVEDEGGSLRKYEKARVLDVIRLVDPAPGQQGMIWLADGGARSGVIIEDTFEHVIFEVEGVRAKLPRRLVDRVELEPAFEEQYAAYKMLVHPDRPQGYLELCRWLFDREQYELAAIELNTLLKVHDEPAARQLLRLCAAQRALAEAKSTDQTADAAADERGARDDDEVLVTLADVNLMRVYEIDFKRPPKIALSRETIHRLVENYSTNPLLPASADDREALFTAEPLEILEELIFPLRARELYGEVDVLTEPYALNQYRRFVHDTWLMNNCATSRCHGGEDAGLFQLRRGRRRDPRVRFTNLLILERLEIDPEWPLVNYERPLDSLIIQYGLPPAEARKIHPPVPGWRPVFRDPKDRMIRRSVEWIDSMMQPRVPYPVVFDPLANRDAEEAAGEAGDDASRGRRRAPDR